MKPDEIEDLKMGTFAFHPRSAMRWRRRLRPSSSLCRPTPARLYLLAWSETASAPFRRTRLNWKQDAICAIAEELK